MKTAKCFSYFWITLIILLAGAAGCTKSGSDLNFFQGKTITIIVPYGAGGGVDTYARVVAPYLQKYIPGSTVEVKNITDGGGLIGKNQVFTAQPDGLTLGFTPMSGALLAEWGGVPGVKYKTADFSYIGRITADIHVMVASPQSGFTRLDDLMRAGKVRMGFTGVGSDDYYVALITANLLGYQVEPRKDYLSSSDAGLACVKGEVDAILFSESSVRPLIEAQTVVSVVTFSSSRLPNLPDVQTIFEVMPADKQALVQSLVQIYALDRTMIAPPGLPAGRLKVLRDALDKGVADPEYVQAMAAIKRPVKYLTGAEISATLKGILASEEQIRPLVLMIAQGSQ
jgi:tripartite-type tricarboxylate transporter receptor subunit TctC